MVNKAEGKYIYGIIDSDGGGFLGPCLPAEASAWVGGVTACEEIYTIPYQDISAVVSESEIVDYTRMPKDALARILVRHQKVIERVMSQGCEIIPVRLGTFATDESEVKDILSKGYGLIKDIMERIGDKIEIDVAATWRDFGSFLKEVGEEKEIKGLRERLLVNPQGITVDYQMKVGVMIKKTLDEKRERYAFQIQNALMTVSQGFKMHEPMDDTMVINAAFLINKAEEKDFDRKVEELNTKFAERLNFRCVGPLPPYSFYTLEVKKMRFEEIDWARKKLRLLNDFTTKGEIKKAYRESALFSHPDKNPNTPGIERQFGEVTRAYKILIDYCRVREQAGQGDSCPFNEGEFKKNAVLVRLRE